MSMLLLKVEKYSKCDLPNMRLYKFTLNKKATNIFYV